MPDLAADSRRPPLPEALSRPVIDSHCHIDMRGQGEDILSPRMRSTLPRRST